jgi:Asp/Glu/hydantoin racemase
LLINPNSSIAVSDRLAAEAKRVVPPGIVIRALTNAAGPEGIQTAAELDAARSWVLTTIPRIPIAPVRSSGRSAIPG